VTKKLTVEDVLSDELKREMNLDADAFVVHGDGDSSMHNVIVCPSSLQATPAR